MQIIFCKGKQGRQSPSVFKWIGFVLLDRLLCTYIRRYGQAKQLNLKSDCRRFTAESKSEPNKICGQNLKINRQAFDHEFFASIHLRFSPDISSGEENKNPSQKVTFGNGLNSDV